MGALHVQDGMWLVALAALPLLFRHVRTRRERAAAACRALASAALILTLAGLHIERAQPEQGTCLVAVIDVSASVGTAAVTQARTFLDEALALAGPHDLLGSVAFGSYARVIARPDPPTSV